MADHHYSAELFNLTYVYTFEIRYLTKIFKKFTATEWKIQAYSQMTVNY